MHAAWAIIVFACVCVWGGGGGVQRVSKFRQNTFYTGNISEPPGHRDGKKQNKNMVMREQKKPAYYGLTAAWFEALRI